MWKKGLCGLPPLPVPFVAILMPKEGGEEQEVGLCAVLVPAKAEASPLHALGRCRLCGFHRWSR
jgi:hypothetical protein